MKYAAALILTFTLAAPFAAQADHARPGLFTDVGAPPAAEDPSHANVSAKLVVDRCTRLMKSVRLDKEGHIRDYAHNYRTGFCLAWVNASMVFLNMRDSGGAPALGVCLPEGIHTDDVIKTFLDFAKTYPEDLKYNPTFLIYWSMLDKYPCQK